MITILFASVSVIYYEVSTTTTGVRMKVGPFFLNSADSCTERTKATTHTPFVSNGALSKNENSRLRLFVFRVFFVLVFTFEGRFR